MGIEVKLFRFSLPDEKESLYLYSIRSDEKYLRSMFYSQDNGDVPHELYTRLAEQGNITRVNDIESIPGAEREYGPYHSYELDNNGFGLTIRQFFDPPIEYRS